MKKIDIPVIAVLITCHNREKQTIQCLKKLFEQDYLSDFFLLNVFLVDDGSTDNTYMEISNLFPQVNLIKGDGSLFWAGGTRLAWKTSIENGRKYDFFFLLNDDTELYKTALKDLLKDYSGLDKLSILVGTTIDPLKQSISYGGGVLTNNYNISHKMLSPNNISPQLCHLGNANIMLIPSNVFEIVGMLSDHYTHGIADYDYTLRAKKIGIKSYIGSKISGACKNDHGNNWIVNLPFKKRLEYLYSVKGLSYKEYLKFTLIHFPFSVPFTWLQLWLKTFLPVLWEKYKK